MVSPAHILLALAAMLTEAVIVGVTLITILAELAIGVVRQVALLVIWQPTVSLLTSVEVV